MDATNDPLLLFTSWSIRSEDLKLYKLRAERKWKKQSTTFILQKAIQLENRFRLDHDQVASETRICKVTISKRKTKSPFSSLPNQSTLFFYSHVVPFRGFHISLDSTHFFGVKKKNRFPESEWFIMPLIRSPYYGVVKKKLRFRS